MLICLRTGLGFRPSYAIDFALQWEEVNESPEEMRPVSLCRIKSLLKKYFRIFNLGHARNLKMSFFA